LSFSSIVKSELCRIESRKSCCLQAELAAVVKVSIDGGLADASGSAVRIITENAAFVRRMFSIIKKLYKIHPQLTIRRGKKLKKHISYILVVSSAGLINVKKDHSISAVDGKNVNGDEFLAETAGDLKKNCCKRAYLRGAFLAGGSISDPEKSYHLEIKTHSRKLANELCGLIGGFNLNAKTIKRKGSYVVYLKEGENIVDFLNIIGAHFALLELENVRILKGMRNSVNRIVNCETANLEKTVNASVRQIENIKYIRDFIGFENLPENLREIADIRLSYPDANLKELGEMLSPSLGKSGVNHRLRKLDKIAENRRNLKGD